MNQEDIQTLAHMARMHVSEEEGQALAESFDSIIAYVDQIRGLETSGDSETQYPFSSMGRSDEEEPQATFSKDIIMQDMPAREDTYLKVKKIL